jgi:hypothetical protein
MRIHIHFSWLSNLHRTSHSAKQTVSAPSVLAPNRQSYSILISRQSQLQTRSQIQRIFILHARQGRGQRPLQALTNHRSYLNLQSLLASRPGPAPLPASINMHLWARIRHESTLCGGGVEYLHRDPASRRRRWKGKSQIWDSKIWLRVQRDSDPRKTTLASASSLYKSQTRPLVREDAHKNRAVIVKDK